MTGNIAVIEYKGKNGGFAVNLSTMYRVELTGINGEVRPIGFPTTNRNYANQDAYGWADLTGFQVKNYKEHESRTVRRVEV